MPLTSFLGLGLPFTEAFIIRWNNSEVFLADFFFALAICKIRQKLILKNICSQVSTVNKNPYLCAMKVETKNLITVKKFALQNGVSPSYVYRLIREGKMESFVIDGVHFIDIAKQSSIPGR